MTNTKETKMRTGYAARRKVTNAVVYIILGLMVLIWLFPIAWLVLQSFNKQNFISTDLFPKEFSFEHYATLFTDPKVPYGRWITNTFIVAVLSCVISTLFILMVSYALSRLRFKSRKKLLNAGLILGMFPGFMSMAATYSIMEIVHLDQQLFALVIVYSAGAGLGYQVAKGFFDTIPRSLDEAAKIDGATTNRIFWVIILPLSKPIIVYTALTTFLGPWADYIFVSYFMKDNEQSYTVALGLYNLLDNEHINNYFTTFCAGAVLIAIPITILFVVMQRFYVAGVTGGAVKG
jgi:arabinogalactan oligomer/maltooligosaccharide transport system permease protein